MKEPTEKIVKVHFHLGQQFGTKVMNSIDAVKSLDSHAKKPELMEWHLHGVKIRFNGVTRVCSMATVHGIDCEDLEVRVTQMDPYMPEVKRSPGRPRANA